MRRLAILGSTGSIGTQTLKEADFLKEEFQVVALAARSQIDLLEKQAKHFHPQLVALFDENLAKELQKRLPEIPVIAGMEGLQAVATLESADMVVSALSGTVGILPTLTAIRAGKTVALANKEVLVSAGELVMAEVKAMNTLLLPVDSEHGAIFQCLKGQDKKSVRRLIITASGGPFFGKKREELREVTVEQALRHNYAMGPKNTIDSSTLMNKGLEVIEARWLFDIPLEQIEVVVQRESMIHSLVEFSDYSILAQMGYPSMLIPIQAALTYPKRMPGLDKPFDFTQPTTLHLFPPDYQTFKCLPLAIEAARKGGSYPCYLNAANEVLVHRFLSRQISWLEIGDKLEGLMDRHQPVNPRTIEEILEIDQAAKADAKSA